MDHLRSTLLEAQRRGLIPPGQSQVEQRLAEVDSTDIRRIAKMIHGWQQKCVDVVRGPYEEATSPSKPSSVVDLLRVARERGVIASDDELEKEAGRLERKVRLRQSLPSAEERDFDMGKYKDVMEEMEEKLEWVREFRSSWAPRLIAHHERRLTELRKALGRAQRAELIFGSAAEGIATDSYRARICIHTHTRACHARRLVGAAEP